MRHRSLKFELVLLFALISLIFETLLSLFIFNYPESEGNQNTGPSSLNDELGVVELQIVVKDNLGGLVHAIQPVVTE